jgi:hypothetical protein
MITPGPWRAIAYPKTGPLYPEGTWLVVGPDSDLGDSHTVAVCLPCDPHNDRAEDDAHKIAEMMREEKAMDRYEKMPPEARLALSCTECGAVVWYRTVHDEWHRRMNEMQTVLRSLARQSGSVLPVGLSEPRETLEMVKAYGQGRSGR